MQDFLHFIHTTLTWLHINYTCIFAEVMSGEDVPPPPYTPHLPEHYPAAAPVSRFHDNHTTTVHHNRPVTESVLAFIRAVNSHSQWPRSYTAYWSRSQSWPMSSEGSMSAYVSAYVYQTRIHLSVSTVFIVAWIESSQIEMSDSLLFCS